VVFFSLVVFGSIAALSLSAGGHGDPFPEADGGRWAQVCCGSMCHDGMDYCMGTGSLTCCK
jgi:hypothetical protein